MIFKKAWAPLPYFAVFSLLIFGGVFVTLHSERTQFRATLGETHLEIITVYDKAEESLLFLDQTAKYSGYQTLHSLASKGGFNEPECGMVDGYAKYIDGSKQCYFDDMAEVRRNVEIEFNKFLLEMLAGHLPQFPLEYTYEIADKDGLIIMGKTQGKLNFDIKDYGKYSVKPNFKIYLAYNLGEYGLILTKVKAIEAQCSRVENQLIIECVKRNLPEKAVVVNYNKDKPREFKVEMFSDSKFYNFDGARSTLEPVNIKFAMVLPDLVLSDISIET